MLFETSKLIRLGLCHFEFQTYKIEFMSLELPSLVG